MTHNLENSNRHTAVIIKMAACVDGISPHMGGNLLAEHLRNQAEPFQLTADPKFCYLDPARRHASARLLSGLYAGDGLFILTGRAGIGKSILLRHLAEQLNALDVVYPLASMQVFACRTGTVLADIFGACEAQLRLGESIASPLKAAKRLQQLAESARSPFLLLDDADLLGDDVLEGIVTLSGLQASDRSLLSVVLAGHPSVVGRLAAIGGESIQQAERIINLDPMTEADIGRLIRHRLRTAERPEDALGGEAIARVMRHAGGVPLSVVRTCRRALQLADSRSLKSVTADLVGEAIAEEPCLREPTLAISGTSPAESTPRPEVNFRRPAPITAPAVPVGESELAARAAAQPLVQPSLAHPAPPAAARASRITPDADIRPLQPAHADGAVESEPSLIRERHMSLPHVTLGRPARGERTTRDYAVDRRRRRGSRIKLTLGGIALFLILVVTGLLVLGGARQLGDATRTSLTAGLQDESAPPVSYEPPYKAEEDSTAWWRPTTTADPAGSGAEAGRDADVPVGKELNPLPGLAARDGGQSPTPADNDLIRNARPGGVNPIGNEAASASLPPAPTVMAPDTGPRAGTTSAPEHREQPPTKLPEVAPKKESRPIAMTQPPVPPQPKPAAQASKPAGPQVAGPQAKQQHTAEAKVGPARTREIDSLLAEGDARLAEGDMDGARFAYEQAYDKGSRAAASRMAQTFDPRNVAGTRKSASPAEAILWYQDAARKGDRGAKEELDNLAGWLENDAASGNQEARRVLDLWRQPAEPESESEAAY